MQSSFAEVAKILSEFFRDLDVVPSDVIAGLIIVRKNQKLQRELTVNNYNNDITQYLSGVPITSKCMSNLVTLLSKFINFYYF